MARLPYCRYVTLLLWRVFRLAAITVPRSRMLAKMPVSFVYSRPHRCRICAFDASGVKENVRIEPTGYNVVRHRAPCNSVLFYLFRCLRPVKIQRHVADDVWQNN